MSDRERFFDSYFRNPTLFHFLGIFDYTLDMWKGKVAFSRRVKSVLNGDFCKDDHDRELWQEWLAKYEGRLVNSFFHIETTRG